LGRDQNGSAVYHLFFLLLACLLWPSSSLKIYVDFSYYIVPFLLMGFVFLEPCLPRYHAFIYPLYLVTVVSAFYYVPALIKKITPKWPAYHSWIGFVALIGFVILFITSKAIKNSITLITLEKYGTVIDKKLSQWSFTNWRDPSLYVKKRLKPGDLIFATIPAGVDFYLGADQKSSIYPFRQMRLNAEDKTYVPLGNSAQLPSASSFDDFYKTLQRNQRVWLISDYYFYNVMTEGRCRDLVFQNFTLIPEASKDGKYTIVFIWDPLWLKNSIIIAYGAG
jgi:hypothetical protein